MPHEPEQGCQQNKRRQEPSHEVNGKASRRNGPRFLMQHQGSGYEFRIEPIWRAGLNLAGCYRECFLWQSYDVLSGIKLLRQDERTRQVFRR